MAASKSDLLKERNGSLWYLLLEYKDKNITVFQELFGERALYSLNEHELQTWAEYCHKFIKRDIQLA